MIKSRPPFEFYLWTGFSIALTIGLMIVGMSIIGSIIYGVFGIALLYMLLNTRDCRIEIIDGKLIIHYLRPIFNKEVIDLKDVDEIVFQDGKFPNLLHSDVDRFIDGTDKLILISQHQYQVVLINSRKSDVLFIIDEFNERNALANFTDNTEQLML